LKNISNDAVEHQFIRVNPEKLTSGSNMLKNSRLHGDVDLELCEIFTTRVSELTTLRRLVGFI
jgi:hypothetical protein